MTRKVRIGIIGDFEPNSKSHIATNEALKHCAQNLGFNLEIKWLPTVSLVKNVEKSICNFDGFWCAPGVYKSIEGTLNAINYARENDYPFIGTCGGFQQTVIEYSRNKLNLQDVQHIEYSPDALNLIITKLTCSLVGKTSKVYISKNSKLFNIYSKTEVYEKFSCNFGINPKYEEAINEGGLKVVGVDENDESRILELPHKNFFVATLYQPQLTSTYENPHKLILAYLLCAKEFHLLHNCG